jgi:hypothetical protein
MSKILLILILLFSCKSKDKPKPWTMHETMRDRTELYLDLLEQDKDGFIMSDHCDSLLFTGLLAASNPKLNIDLLKARDSSGAWHRRPNKDCGPDVGNSRSTISRDMMLGVLWWAYKTKNLKVLEELRDSLHGLVLPGRGDVITRTMLPVYYKTLVLLIQRLGGKKAPYVPLGDTFSKKGGFVAHLNVLHIILRGQLGSITMDNFELLKYHAKRQPKNPLFVGAYILYLGLGPNTNQTLNMFKNRLPNTDDWCSPYVLERDYGSDWEPCTPYKQHIGLGLLVLGLLYK